MLMVSLCYIVLPFFLHKMAFRDSSDKDGLDIFIEALMYLSSHFWVVGVDS